MSRIILYIAISLDGYIADENGNVDWIEGHEENKEDNSYNEFLENIDTIIMGRKTYEQIINKLSPNNWPYSKIKSYVLTSKKLEEDKNVIFINEDISEFVKKIKQGSEKNIWILGGNKLANQLIKDNLIDDYEITIVPKILGNGIKLFNFGLGKIDLHLNNIYEFNGLIKLSYSKIIQK